MEKTPQPSPDVSRSHDRYEVAAGSTAGRAGSGSPISEANTGTSTPSQRLLSLDAYRGFVMLSLVAGEMFVGHALGIGAKASGHPAWSWVHNLWTHAGWEGAFPWDMIQPAFMFIVGVAVPFSYAKRKAMGESYCRMLGHAVYRAIVLVLLGVVIRSMHNKQTYWTFEDVVSQIGLGWEIERLRRKQR